MEPFNPFEPILDRLNFAKHFGPQWPYKMCEPPEWDREEFLESIDFDNLVSISSSFRSGIRCRIASEYFGQENLVYEIEFEDGVAWIARIPMLDRQYKCDEPVLEDTIQRYLFRSMIAAQTFARIKKDVFAPVIHAAFFNSDNPVGVPFALMQKIEGERLDETIGHQTDATLRIVFSDLAREMVSLASPPYFTQIGSLFEEDDEYRVGPMISYPSLQDDAIQLDQRGPYATVEEYLISALDRHATVALSDNNRTLSQQIAGLRALLPSMVDKRFNSGPFILSPFDWLARDIFHSADSTISGVLDWDFASVVPLQVFFRYPPFMTRDWTNGITSPLMQKYRRLFRECLAELQDETELPLLELLDQARWFQIYDEGVQNAELGRQALPTLENHLGINDDGPRVEGRKLEIKAIPVVRGTPILKDVNIGKLKSSATT
jgi:hypothetical protein